LKSSNKYGIINREKFVNRPVIVNHESEQATLNGVTIDETSFGSSHHQSEQTAIIGGPNSENNDGASVNHQSERTTVYGILNDETSVGSPNLQIEQPTLNGGSSDETNDSHRVNHVNEVISFNVGINKEINASGSVDSVEYDYLVVGGGGENSLGEENEEDEAKKWYEQNFNRSL
jgi:hypothetical protein